MGRGCDVFLWDPGFSRFFLKAEGYSDLFTVIVYEAVFHRVCACARLAVGLSLANIGSF